MTKLIKNFTFLCLVIIAGLVLTTDVVLGEEPDITITIDEKISVGDSKTSDPEIYEEKSIKINMNIEKEIELIKKRNKKGQH